MSSRSSYIFFLSFVLTAFTGCGDPQLATDNNTPRAYVLPDKVPVDDQGTQGNVKSVLILDDPKPVDNASYNSLAGVETGAFGRSHSPAMLFDHVRMGAMHDDAAVATLLAVASMQASRLASHVSATTADANQVDGYQIDLSVDGNWETLQVSANVPTNAASSTEGPHEMWAPLYEKAMAAVLGSYAALVKATPGTLMTLVSGSPASQSSSPDAALQALRGGGAVVARASASGFFDPSTGYRANSYATNGVNVSASTYYAITRVVDDVDSAQVFLMSPTPDTTGSNSYIQLSDTAFKRLFKSFAITTP